MAGGTLVFSRMKRILDALDALDCGTVLITGVRFGEEEIGVVCREKGADRPFTVSAPCSDAPLHGTGDVFASVLAAYSLHGFSMREAVQKTVRFVSAAIRETEREIQHHWYGVKFEGSLAMLADDVRKKQLQDWLNKESSL